MTAETLNPIEDTVSELIDLATLRADWQALKQHAADVTDRYRTRKADLDDVIAKYEQTWAEANAELIKEYEEITGAFKSKDSELRSAVVAAYDANPERKTVAAGLSVRISEKVVTTDIKARLAWVKANAPVCLVVDDEAFDKLIKIEEKVTAVISDVK